MKLPEEVRQAFVKQGRRGGKLRAARMTSQARRAVARRAAASRWIRERFGSASFESPQSLAVSLAAPRLRREGVPVAGALPNADERLYSLLSTTLGDRAHSRYLALLEQLASFADACRYRRLLQIHAR
jgi:hypothetical protein